MENYHLITQIGEGSFGRVYKARRKYTGRLVAIKMINKLGQSRADLQSFRREIDILKKVDHPNIMRMLEIFETDTDFCLVTELGRGDLFQVINDEQTLPEEVLRSVAAQLVSALTYLHSMRIIHRDLKPQNVLISANGTLKLCDFGFARALSNTTLVLNSIKGTPLYMAPELVQEQQYNEKVDIWSLGVILYELYYGKPPFFTNSIYKLIQMIVNDQIIWPSPISAEFKDFLSKMLQKNPDIREPCAELMKEKFISDVDLISFDDEFYRYKTRQFEEAIHESEPTLAKLSPEPDFQSVFVNPSAHSNEELQNAVKYLIESDPDADSPLASSFSFHFKEFISRPPVVESALRAAELLLSKDREKYLSAFQCGADLLGDADMPKSAIDFFTQLLLIPFSVKIFTFGIENAQKVKTVMDDQSAERMKNHLLSFLFTQDVQEVAKTYSLMSYLAQTSDSFVAVLSGNLASQVIPIITSHVTHNTSSTVVAAGFAILEIIVSHSASTIQLIQPFSEFIGALESVLSQIPHDIEAFCLFSAAFSFLKSTFSVLSQMSEFQKLAGKREYLSSLQTFINCFYSTRGGTSPILRALLEVGSQKPETTIEYLAYVSIRSSPFQQFPVDVDDLDECISEIGKLLVVHQPGLLDSICSLPIEDVAPNMEKLAKFFDNYSCIERMSSFVLSSLKNGADSKQIFDTLFKCSIMNTLSSAIEDFGQETPFTVKVMLVRVVLAITPQTPLLMERVGDVLKTVYSLETTAEAGVIITAHFARLGEKFIPVIESSGGFKFIEYMMKFKDDAVRSRALSAFGNILKHKKYDEDDLSRIFPSVFALYKGSNRESKRFAAYALANLVYQAPSFAEAIVNDISTVTAAFELEDPQTIEYSANLVCNIARAGEKYIAELISEGLVKKSVQLLENKDELAVRMLNRIAIFCKYEEGKKYMRNKGVRSLIFKMCSSKFESAQQIAKKMISVIDA